MMITNSLYEQTLKYKYFYMFDSYVNLLELKK